jgi:hypothetical protein
VLGLGWPASIGFVVGPSPIVWSVSESALLLSPLLAPMSLLPSVPALVSVLVLGSALGMGLGLVWVYVSALALI